MKHKEDPKFVKLGQRLEELREKHEQGLITRKIRTFVLKGGRTLLSVSKKSRRLCAALYGLNTR